MTATVSAYDEAIGRLLGREPNRMVPDLDRIRHLVELLGHPEGSYSAIAITGTNGKTTTAAMVSCLLGALRLVPGGFTSPHLQDVRERIRVARELIEPDALLWHLQYLEPFLAAVDAAHPDRTTFFEVLTAAALLHFADAPVDVAVLEVGMGGRWDATNVVDAAVAVVLPVALDHVELGATVAEVAAEKAGIIKDGAVAISAAQPSADAAAVLERAARERDARLLVAGRDFDVLDRRRAVGGQHLVLRGLGVTVEEVYLPLFGEHQAANAACALAAVEALVGGEHDLDADVVREGFAAVTSPGRLELVHRGDGRAPVLLDGAHNPAGAVALARSLRTEFSFRSRVGVLGILGDKDVEGLVARLAPALDHVVACAPATSRAAPVERVARAAEAAGLSVEVARRVEDALERAEGVAGDDDGVVVTGSLRTVGEARDALQLPPA